MTQVSLPAEAGDNSKRAFTFTFAIQNGALFIDTARHAILSFTPGRYLAIGDRWEMVSGTEAEEREERATKVGLQVGREEVEKLAAEVKPTRRPMVSQTGTQLVRGVIKLLDAIEDDTAHEKAYADFGMHILTLLSRGPSEDVTIMHLEAAAKALGMKPSELLLEATS